MLGADEAAAELLHAARRLAVTVIEPSAEGIRIDPFAPELRNYLILSMGSLPTETLRVLFLDSGKRLIADERLQDGSISQLAVYPRTIMQRALELNAAAIILVHNHPSGDATPSEADIEATRRIEAIARSLEIELVDHIIVTTNAAHHLVRDPPVGRRGRSSYILRSPPAGDGRADDAAVANVRATLRQRMLRKQLIGTPELFGEPAWEMLLDVFIHESERKPLPTTSLCVTAGMPMSSALRLVQRMCDTGMLTKVPDPFDGRRSFVKLTPAMAHKLRAYFETSPPER